MSDAQRVFGILSRWFHGACSKVTYNLCNFMLVAASAHRFLDPAPFCARQEDEANRAAEAEEEKKRQIEAGSKMCPSRIPSARFSDSGWYSLVETEMLGNLKRGCVCQGSSW